MLIKHQNGLQLSTDHVAGEMYGSFETCEPK